MECRTVIRYNKKGKAITKNKVKHDNFFTADAEAKRLNSLKNVFIKRVAYKCNVCEKYHVGTTLEMLENKKAKTEYLGVRMIRFKLEGVIDESLLTKKKVTPISKLPKKPKIKYKNSPIKKAEYYFGDGVWSYDIRPKTVKIISPAGICKILKIEKMFPLGATRDTVKSHIRKNSSILSFNRKPT